MNAPICAAGSCEFCGCTFRKPSDVLRHRCAAMQEGNAAPDPVAETRDVQSCADHGCDCGCYDYRKLKAENRRLRDLYENAVGNRDRFGWTINHLLECEEALRVVQEEATGLRAILDGLMEVYKPEGVGVWLTGAHRNFGGDSALDLIRAGRTAEVAAEVERLTSGAFS